MLQSSTLSLSKEFLDRIAELEKCVAELAGSVSMLKAYEGVMVEKLKKFECEPSELLAIKHAVDSRYNDVRSLCVGFKASLNYELDRATKNMNEQLDKLYKQHAEKLRKLLKKPAAKKSRRKP